MPAFRSVVSMLLSELGDFSLHPQGRPCGRPPAALRPGSDTTVTGEPASPSIQGEPEQSRACRLVRAGSVPQREPRVTSGHERSRPERQNRRSYAYRHSDLAWWGTGAAEFESPHLHLNGQVNDLAVCFLRPCLPPPLARLALHLSLWRAC